MINKEQLIKRVNTASFMLKETDSSRYGHHAEVQLDLPRIRDFALIMAELGLYPVFVTAVHADPRMQVVYQFASMDIAFRIVARASVGEDNAVPTISDILDGANWHEREVRDLFGVTFTGHPELKPLILPDEDVDLTPLRKKDGQVKGVDDVFNREGVEP